MLLCIIVSFGVPLGVINAAPQVLPFAKSFDRSFEIMIRRFFDVTWRIQRFFNFGLEKELKHHVKIVHEFLNKIVRERKQIQTRNTLNKRFDLLSLFLKQNPNICNQELRDITANFVIAGMFVVNY